MIGIDVLELSNRLITAFGSATELAKADWRMVIEQVAGDDRDKRYSCAGLRWQKTTIAFCKM